MGGSHWVVWTPTPLFHPSICSSDQSALPPAVTGLPTPPGTPNRHSSPSLGDETGLPKRGSWDWVRTRGLTGATGFDDVAVRPAEDQQPEREIEACVKSQWPEDQWETLW